MNQDLAYQNREIMEPNPMDVAITPKTPLNPKVKLLLILAIIIVLLLITGLIVSSVKKPLPGLPAPTPTPSLSPVPTVAPESAIPTVFRDKFNQIDQYNQTDINFNPPLIDPNIGQ